MRDRRAEARSSVFTQGRALSIDCDMQAFGDMAELWQIPFQDATVLCTNQPEPPDQWRDDPNDAAVEE